MKDRRSKKKIRRWAILRRRAGITPGTTEDVEMLLKQAYKPGMMRLLEFEQRAINLLEKPS